MTREQAAVAALLCLHLLVALVWATLAAVVWRLLAARRSPVLVRRPLVAMSVLAAAAYTLVAFFTLVPPAIHAASPAWLRLLYVAVDACMVGALAAFRHLTWRIPIGGPAPGRVRLAALYGGAALLVLFDAAVWRTPTPSPALLRGLSALYGAYFVVVLLGAGRRIAAVARRGSWRPDSVFVVRRRDLAIVGALILANLVMSTLLLATGGWEVHPWALQALSAGIGLTAAIPFAARVFGAVLRVVLLVAAALLATGGVYAVAHLVLLPLVPRELAPAVHVGTVLAIVVLLVAGQRWVRSAVDRLLLRRTRRQVAELQAVVHALSPELGRLECTQRVLGAVVRVLGLPGAAVVLRDGTACAAGTVDGEALCAAWPREGAADSLPRRLFFSNEIDDGALRDLLVEQRIAGIVPIASPRVRWGDLFASTSLLGTAFAEEDGEALEMIAQQLGLLLDGTALLERAVAVERSLAHAEKLAAIGETAARIAHDIRNPVTAARSLAQQLAREPAVPFREELDVILEALDRVERQVADLLHFARREEPRLEPVNLSALVETTVTQLRPRLESAGVVVTLDLQPGIAARGDRERLRQVLVNLVENAAEALGGAPRRELSVRVEAANGHATLRVSDTGPGVPEDAMTRLFEPFFSLKANGTGLGLAIAKRTLEAHGGRITAAIRPDGGMTFDVDLPLAEAGAR
jgi:signal transduction histidine kinase